MAIFFNGQKLPTVANSGRIFSVAYDGDDIFYAQLHNVIIEHSFSPGYSAYRVATDDTGNFYFGTQNYLLIAIDKNGNRLWSYSYSDNTNIGPETEQVLADNQGHVYFTRRSFVYKVDAKTGNLIWKNNYNVSSFKNGRNLMLYGDYVYSLGGYLTKIAPDGKTVWSNKLAQASGAIGVTGCDVDDKGNIYVGSGTYILRYDTDGNYLGQFEVNQLPNKISADRFGNILMGSTDLVQSYKSDGTFNWQRSTGVNPDGSSNYSRGISVDYDGNSYAVTDSKEVLKFDREGNPIWTLDMPDGGYDIISVSKQRVIATTFTGAILVIKQS